MATALVPAGPVPVRRGILFLVNIGVPVLAGVATDESQMALLGAVVGMLLAFADNDGPLPGRLRLLVIDAAAISAGGLGGYLSHNSEAVLWPVFIAITFLVGLAARGGREPLLAGRHAAMAYTVATAVPSFTALQICYLAGALALNALSRTIDHLIAGPLPRLPAAALQMPSGHGGWLRFAFAYAGAATAALWLGGALDETHRFWIVITTLVVMQPDAQASYRRIVERIAGTFAGVIAAWAITATFHSVAVICLAILIVAPLIPHHVTQRYWLHTALIALMVLLAYDLTLLDAQDMSKLLIERLMDILVGCAMALIGTAVAFPRKMIAATGGAADGSE